jgi:hypothetical protein
MIDAELMSYPAAGLKTILVTCEDCDSRLQALLFSLERARLALSPERPWRKGHTSYILGMYT